jgi:hypothetical protein
MTVAIDIGSTGGQRATLDLEELLATRLLVQGNSGSGKSHLLRRLLEQSAPWVQQAVIDPEGDFVTLADRFGHLVIDASVQTEASLLRAAQLVRQHRVSVVLNLEGLEVDGQMRHAAAFLGGLFDAERDAWTPLLVVVDEAQLFAPAIATEATEEARRAALSAMTNLMCRGRKRGLAGVIATQRLAKLAKNVAAEASNFLMGRTFLDIDMARAADLLGMERRMAEQFRDLPRGDFLALGPAITRRPLQVRIGAVETESRGVSPRLLALPETTPDEVRDQILAPPPPDAPRPRRAAAAPVPDLVAQLSAARPTALPDRAELMPPDPVALADRRARIGSILAQILADPEASFRPVSVLYQDFLVRCRIAEIAGRAPDLAGFRRLLAIARAGLTLEEADSADWAEVMARGGQLPDDIQSIFLLLARAARSQAPCPSDADIARAFGTRSPARARRQLTWLDEQCLIVSRTDASGRRIVTLVGVGWETTPGDPDQAAA